ncbi:MAG TPA: hypothetical protein VN976_21815 [Verrucomicrobiae bacterium]|nr:hypothetical protein [Verrucomicrobiae bacterium]
MGLRLRVPLAVCEIPTLALMDADRHVRTVALVGVALTLAWAVHRASDDLHVLSGSIQQASASYAQIPTQLAPAIQQLNAATAGQIKTLNREDTEVLETSAAVKEFVVRLDHSLTEAPDGLLPKAGLDLDATRRVLDRSADTVDSLDGVARDARGTVQALTLRVQDPRYDQILADAASSMENLKATTASGAHALAKTDEGITYEVNQLEKPVSKLKAAVLFSVRLIGRFLGF